MKIESFEKLTKEERCSVEKNAIVLLYTYKKDNHMKSSYKIIRTTEDYYALRDTIKYHNQGITKNGHISDGKRERSLVIQNLIKQDSALKTIDYYVRFQKVAQSHSRGIEKYETITGFIENLLKILGGTVIDENGHLVDRIDLNRLDYASMRRSDLRNVGNKYEFLHELVYCERGWPIRVLLYNLQRIGITDKDLLQMTRILANPEILTNSQELKTPVIKQFCLVNPALQRSKA